MALSNSERVGKALNEVRDGLLPYLSRELYDKLGPSWQDRLNPGTNLQDVAVLLGLFMDHWSGVFKQVLIDSGAGQAVAGSLASAALPPLVVAWLVAAVIRVLQGSATVAMITAAGLVAPLVETAGRAEPFPALMTIAIAAGASIASHVNDSGFWLVSKFLGLSVGETLATWTIIETIVAVAGLVFVLLLAAVL